LKKKGVTMMDVPCLEATPPLNFSLLEWITSTAGFGGELKFRLTKHETNRGL